VVAKLLFEDALVEVLRACLAALEELQATITVLIVSSLDWTYATSNECLGALGMGRDEETVVLFTFDVPSRSFGCWCRQERWLRAFLLDTLVKYSVAYPKQRGLINLFTVVFCTVSLDGRVFNRFEPFFRWIASWQRIHWNSIIDDSWGLWTLLIHQIGQWTVSLSSLLFSFSITLHFWMVNSFDCTLGSLSAILYTTL
jgi:hypothetical protein